MSDRCATLIFANSRKTQGVSSSLSPNLDCHTVKLSDMELWVYQIWGQLLFRESPKTPETLCTMESSPNSTNLYVSYNIHICLCRLPSRNGGVLQESSMPNSICMLERKSNLCIKFYNSITQKTNCIQLKALLIKVTFWKECNIYFTKAIQLEEYSFRQLG